MRGVCFYPWAAPTAEQRRRFDALPDDQQKKLIEQMLTEADDSGVSDRTVSEILSAVLARPLP
jgi:hypothetical protein